MDWIFPYSLFSHVCPVTVQVWGRLEFCHHQNRHYSTLSNEKAIDTIRLPGFALLLLLKPPLILTLHHHHHFTDALVSSHASLLISSHRYSFSGVRFIYSSPIKPFLFMLLSILLSRIATGEMFRSVPDLTARSVSVVAFSLLL
jgi:hypothetical protein